MARLNKHHKELNKKGEGKCSVPMWRGGIPSGFCDKTAYSELVKCDTYWDRNGQLQRKDGRYNGYVPALACPIHGGETKEEAVNLCNNCENEFATCNSSPKFGAGFGNDNVYECDKFKPNEKQ